MPATQIQFFRFKSGRTEDAFDTFRHGKELGERHGAENVRAYRLLQGENTGMVYAMLDVDSLTAYGHFADQIGLDEDWQQLVTSIRSPESPIDYLGSWIMTAAGTFSSTSPCRSQSSLSSFPDQLSLKLRQRPENVEDELAA